MAVLKRYNDATSEWEPVVVGKQGPSGVIDVTAPITNSGTETSAVIGIDESAIEITTSQISDLTATASALNTIDDGTLGFTALSNGTAGVTYQPVSRNYIINGAFDFWQRGTSFTAGGANIYSADRWRINQGTVVREAFTPDELPAAGFGESEFYAKYTNSNVATGAFTQLVEDVRTLAGQTATISFWAKATAPLNIVNNQMYQLFGSGGSANVIVTLPNTSLTTSWERYSYTFTLPSISGKTIGAGSSIMWLWRSPITTESISLWGVQLEAGSVATPFRRNANSIQGELAACQRYFLRVDPAAITLPFGFGMNPSTTASRVAVPTPTQMRAAPTATCATYTVVSNGASSSNPTFSTVLMANGVGCAFTVSGFTTNHTSVFSAAVPLDLSAEL